MAVTSRNLHPGKLRAHGTRTESRGRPASVSVPASRIPYLLTLLLCGTALALVANSLLSWGRIRLDDLRYGRPRTMQLSAVVGHNDGSGTPTQLIAMNLNRRVVVLEIPGGDVTKTRTLAGPYLFGANEDLTPVTLRLAYVNGDREPDLIVSVKREEIIYINENGSFRLINDAERAAYEASGQK